MTDPATTAADTGATSGPAMIAVATAGMSGPAVSAVGLGGTSGPAVGAVATAGMIGPAVSVADTGAMSGPVTRVVGPGGMTVAGIRGRVARVVTRGVVVVGTTGGARATGMSDVPGSSGTIARRGLDLGGTIRRFRKGSPGPSSTGA
jgi:hypothetical protein